MAFAHRMYMQREKVPEQGSGGRPATSRPVQVLVSTLPSLSVRGTRLPRRLLVLSRLPADGAYDCHGLGMPTSNLGAISRHVFPGASPRPLISARPSPSGSGQPCAFHLDPVCPSSQFMCPLFTDTEGGVRGQSQGDGAFSKTLIAKVLSEIWKNLSLHSRQLTRKTQACLRS